MPNPIGPNQIARLEACVASDPGAPEFASLSEALRRAGRLQDAEDVARSGIAHKPGCLEGILVLALVLLDQGRVEEARAALLAGSADSLAALGLDSIPAEAPLAAEPAIVPGDFAGEVTDGELERAFEAAEPVLDQLVDADSVAEAAIRGASLDEPELDPGDTSDPIFATRTMAELLEAQGDAAGAARIREELAMDEGVDDSRRGRSAHRDWVIARLETWLNNLRRQPK